MLMKRVHTGSVDHIFIKKEKKREIFDNRRSITELSSLFSGLEETERMGVQNELMNTMS